jgi:hypothetical protein
VPGPPIGEEKPPPAAPKPEPPPVVAPAMEGTIPIPVLRQIKDATVFIKTDAGAASATGSGFLMHRDGDTAYFATNDHVVTPQTTVVTVGKLRTRMVQVNVPKARISVVLHSGTPREQVLPAELLAGEPHGSNFTRLVTVKAKDGYAVGAVTARVGLTVDSMAITFMRIAGDALDPQDAYTTERIGGRGGFGDHVLGGSGRPVVGITGKCNDRDCTGLGLLLRTAR